MDKRKGWRNRNASSELHCPNALSSPSWLFASRPTHHQRAAPHPGRAGSCRTCSFFAFPLPESLYEQSALLVLTFLIISNRVINPLPTPVALRNPKRAQNLVVGAQTNYKIDGGRIISEAHVCSGRDGFAGAWMRMIDAQKFLAALAHRTLRGKQLFGRSFVTDERMSSDITETINCLRPVVDSSDESATLSRTRLARVREHFINMLMQQRYHAVIQ